MPGFERLRPDEQEPFERLHRTVTRSSRFSLTFAVVNSPLQRERLLQALSERLVHGHEVVSVRLESSTAPDAPDTLLEEAARHLDGGGIPGKQVLCVSGIERAFRDPKATNRLLSSLNRERERFPRRLNVPLVIWLPEFALERIAREAPDFWAWRSGVFTFPQELGSLVISAREGLGLPEDLANLTAEEKRRRINSDRDLLRNLGTGGDAADRVAEVQLEIAHLHRMLGEIEEALAAYREAERLAQATGNTGMVLKAAVAVEELTGRGRTKDAPEISEVSGDRGITGAALPGVGAGPKEVPPRVVRDLVVRLRPSFGSKHTVDVGGSPSHEIDIAPLIHRPTALLEAGSGRLRAFGYSLMQALFRSGTLAERAWEAFRSSTRAGQGRVVLELRGREAASVAWEYAADVNGRFITLDYEIVRRLDLVVSFGGPTNAKPDGPVRVLIVESDPLLSPGNGERVLDRIDVAKETDDLVGALRKSGRQYILRRVLPPTVKTLHLDLARQAIGIVHFNGHGSADPEPVLCFEDETGRLDPVTAADFVGRTSGQAWLVVLSACLSGAVPAGASVSLAHDLSNAGVPWVIGMQDVVPVSEARTFVEAFYRYLGEGHPVWEAVRQARIALGNDNWAAGLAVVYSSGEDPGVIPAQPQGEIRDETSEERIRLGWHENLGALREPTHFFGRETELVAIGEALARGANPVTLQGPGGIGKSALAHRAARRFAWRFPAGVYSGTLADVTEPGTVSPVLVLGRQMLGPKFAELSPEAQEQQLIEAIRSRPCLVVADNAEDALWSRSQSEEASRSLRTLRGATGGRGVLLVATQELLRWPGESVIELPGLDPLSARQLLGTFLEGRKLAACDERLLDEGLAMIEYHPLAIRLLAPAWFDSGLRLADLSAQMESLLERATDDLADKHEHRSLDACFNYAYEVLPEEDRGWLDRLSLFRAPILIEAAAATLASEKHTLLPILVRLLRRSFLTDRREASVKSILFGFQPQVRPFIVRRVAASGLDLTLHRRRFARWYVNMISESVGMLDRAEWEERHRLIADLVPDLVQAVEWTEEPADRSYAAFMLANLLRGLGLLDQAMRLYREALSTHERLGSLQEKAAVLHEMADVYVRRSNLDGAKRLFDEVLEIKERLGDREGKAAALHGIAYIHRLHGDFDKALGLLDESLKITDELGIIRGKAATLRGKADIMMTRGEIDAALRLYEESLDIDSRLGDIRGKSLSLDAMAKIHRLQGEFDQAVRLYEEALGIQKRLGDLDGSAVTLHGMAYIHRLRGDLDGAMRLHRESLAIQERLGDLHGIGATFHAMAGILVIRGDLDQALRFYNQSLDIDDRLGNLQGKAATLHEVAGIHVTHGTLDQATRVYEEALAIQERLGDLQGQAASFHEMAYISRMRDDLVRAMRFYDQSLAIHERLGNLQGKAATLGGMAALYVIRGDLGEAKRLYEEALAIQERIGDFQGKGITLPELAYIYRVVGDLDQAMQLYETSLDIQQRLGNVRGKGATLAMLGQLLFQEGDVIGTIRAVLGSLQALGQLRSAEVPKVLAILSAVREKVGEEEFASAWKVATGKEAIPDWVPARSQSQSP